MHIGECPKCKTIIDKVSVEEVDVLVNRFPTWKGISFYCPYCNSVLGAGFDPSVLIAGMRDEILRALGR